MDKASTDGEVRGVDLRTFGRRRTSHADSDETAAVSPAEVVSTVVDIDDRLNALIASDARRAIESLGPVMRTTAAMFARGLQRWAAFAGVQAIAVPRAKLLKDGSNSPLLEWRVAIPGGKRQTMRGITKTERGRCADIARTLGIAMETMAGLMVETGVLDAEGVPLPFNHRIGQHLAEVLRELEERKRRMRREAGLDRALTTDDNYAAALITWDELVQR